MRQTTLCFLIKGEQIFLSVKKEGFGGGKINGPGGKVEKGETVIEAAARETEEEIGVSVVSDDLEKVAEFRFFFASHPDWSQECHIFFVRKWRGAPRETAEMFLGKWYSFKDIPFDKMWIDDIYWLPRVLAGKKLKGELHFNDTGGALEKYTINEI